MDMAEDPISDMPQAMDTSESGAHNPSVAASNLIEAARAHDREARAYDLSEKTKPSNSVFSSRYGATRSQLQSSVFFHLPDEARICGTQAAEASGIQPQKPKGGNRLFSLIKLLGRLQCIRASDFSGF
ncbi:hypothetical protein ACFX13_009736 [Malus domestica]